MFCMFRYSYNKIYTNEYLNRDNSITLKVWCEVHLKKTCGIKLLD